jgi:hypothetical protein
MKVMRLTAIAALVVAVFTAGAQAASWRTVVAGNDVDRSEYGSVDLSLGTTLGKVNGLRLIARTDNPLKTSVDVNCQRGDTRSDKHVKLSVTTGTHVLPVVASGRSLHTARLGLLIRLRRR